MHLSGSLCGFHGKQPTPGSLNAARSCMSPPNTWQLASRLSGPALRLKQRKGWHNSCRLLFTQSSQSVSVRCLESLGSERDCSRYSMRIVTWFVEAILELDHFGAVLLIFACIIQQLCSCIRVTERCDHFAVSLDVGSRLHNERLPPT
jgi:hypothetical protein